MNKANGLSFTKAVRTLTGRPRKDEILATLVSALVACRWKVSLEWTGCPLSGVTRKPMLVGTSMAYLQLSLRVIPMTCPLFAGKSLDDTEVDVAELLLVHLYDLAVIGHESVDLDLDICCLGVNGCAATLLDQLLELLGE